MWFERFQHPVKAHILRLDTQATGMAGGNIGHTSGLERARTSCPWTPGRCPFCSLVTLHQSPPFKVLSLPLSCFSTQCKLALGSPRHAAHIIEPVNLPLVFFFSGRTRCIMSTMSQECQGIVPVRYITDTLPFLSLRGATATKQSHTGNLSCWEACPRFCKVGRFSV